MSHRSPEFTYTQNGALTFEVHRPLSVDPKGGGTCTQMNSGFRGSKVWRPERAPRWTLAPPHPPIPGAAGSRSTCAPRRGPSGPREASTWNAPLSRIQWTKRMGTEKARGEKGAEPSPERSRDCTRAPPSSPCACSRVNFLARGGFEVRPGEPGGARRGARPTPSPCRRAPSPSPSAPGATREEGGAPRKAKGAKGTLRARTWSLWPAARATLQPRGGRPWSPWPAGAGEPHLLRRVQALPLDGRGHWGGRWRARRRGRSLCGAGMAGCRGSDPLGCSGAAAAAPAPPLAPALRRRARPSALKDSHRAPFKRQRERANHRAAGAPRPRRGPGRAAWPRRLQLLLLLRT